MYFLLSLAVVLVATAGLTWNWIFRNYTVITGNWLKDLVENLELSGKWIYEANDLRVRLLPIVESSEKLCLKQIVPFSVIWATSVFQLITATYSITDPFILVVSFVGVVYMLSVMYNQYTRYCYIRTELVVQQELFDKKAELDDIADA